MADKERKQRIISHVDADHQESLSRFLEYYCRVPSSQAATAHLEDITFSGLILTSGDSGRNFIPLDPPLQEWSEIRQRMVQMVDESLKGLDKSEITVKTYRGPRGFHAVIFVVVLVTILAFWRRKNFLPGSILYEQILHYVPGFARFCYRMQPLVFWFVTVMHTLETTIMVRTRLRRHGVVMFTKLWWKWTISTAIEGFGAFQRIDGMVKRETERRKMQKPTR